MASEARKKLKILILANSRFKGGLSGSDAIYEAFVKHWEEDIHVHSLAQIDYKPFFICYLHRICHALFVSLVDCVRYDLVYSSSDFLPDAIPAVVYKLKGNKWVAGYFLHAFKESRIHYYTQKVVRKLIEWLADMVVVTNPTMYGIFPNKLKTWINGGIDLSLAGISKEIKVYDAVFCGRIHPTKGIDELIDYWHEYKRFHPHAKMALIGDGDLGLDYVRNRIKLVFGFKQSGIFLKGYMGNERFGIYKRSRNVIYPTPLKYDHFSMAPVEAMACGCSLVIGDLPSAKWYIKNMGLVPLGTPEESYNFAKQFDFKEQALRVKNDVMGNLNLMWNVI